MTQRACDELELPDFNLDDNLGEDCVAPGGDLEGESSVTPSQKTTEFGADHVPTIGTKISKDFGSKGYFDGEVVSGPHNVTVEGDNTVVLKVCYRDLRLYQQRAWAHHLSDYKSRLVMVE